jgi:hypothetical protein
MFLTHRRLGLLYFCLAGMEIASGYVPLGRFRGTFRDTAGIHAGA